MQGQGEHSLHCRNRLPWGHWLPLLLTLLAIELTPICDLGVADPADSSVRSASALRCMFTIACEVDGTTSRVAIALVAWFVPLGVRFAAPIVPASKTTS